jgi:flavin-dependent dehydrogenase
MGVCTAKAAEGGPRKERSKKMMEKLERLGRRLRFRPNEDGEQSKPAKGLSWHHKAFVVPVLALVLFAAVSVVASREAQATHQSGWYPDYGTFGYGWCYHVHDDSSDTLHQLGCGYWASDGSFVYLPDYHPGYAYILSNGTWHGPYSYYW